MFENPSLPISKPWENKRDPIFKQWLLTEVSKEPEEWSPDFVAYIEKKYAERNREMTEESDGEKNEQVLDESDFVRSLDILALREEEVRNKKTLDLGCHDGGFVTTCLDKKLTDEVYGLDFELTGDALDQKYSGHFFSGDFKDALPVQDLDYVISVGAVSLYLDEESSLDPVRGSVAELALKNAIMALNENGEVRIGPIDKAVRGDLAGVEASERILSGILARVEKEFDITWKLEPTDIHVTGNEKDVVLNQVLVITKRSE